MAPQQPQRQPVQTCAVHLGHLGPDTLSYLATEGFAISREPGWLFFAGQQPDGPPVVRAIHATEMQPPVLRMLADEGLSLVQDPDLLCFTRPAPPTPTDTEPLPFPAASSRSGAADPSVPTFSADEEA